MPDIAVPLSVNGTLTARVTSLTVLMKKLATKRLPAASTARPAGVLNPEAKVLTAPKSVTWLTVPLFSLAT